MDFKIDKKTLKRIIFGVVGCIVLYWILSDFAKLRSVADLIFGILSPFVVGAVLAFIVNVPSSTVVTAMDQNETSDNIFTNIDGAVIV